MKKPPIEAGKTYELKYGDKLFVVLVLGECTAQTVRFKQWEVAWRMLVLDADGWVGGERIGPGSVVEWVKAAEIFKYRTLLA